MDGRFRPLSLNRWAYVEGNPVNYADPSGLCGVPGEPPCPPSQNGAVPDWWINKKQIYIEGFGFFDPGHVGRGWDSAEWFIQEIEAALTKSDSHGSMVPLARAWSDDRYWVDYAVSSNIDKEDKEEVYGIAYGMFMDFERGYEGYQDSGWSNWSLSEWVLAVDWLSGFSPSDLPSDHLGFWAYMSGYERDELPTLLRCLGELEVYHQQFLGGYIIDSTGIPENHEFLPMIQETVRLGQETVTRTKNIAWPAFLEIQPIPRGSNTWQVLNRSYP